MEQAGRSSQYKRQTIKERLQHAGYAVQTCEACSVQIVYAKTDTGSRMPLDISAPVYALGSSHPSGGGLPVATRMNQCFVSHFKTCSDPNRFSKKT